MWIRVCRYKNAGVAGYAEAFIPVQSDSQASEWYRYFKNDVLALYFFENAQLCAFRSGICFHLFLGRKNRFAGHNMSPARFAAHAHRKFRRTGTGIFISAEGIFYNSVFQRMEGDNAEPSTRRQPINKGVHSNTSSSLLQAIRIA